MNQQIIERVKRITDALSGYRYAYDSEEQLQRGLAHALGENNIPFTRELSLSEHDRIDFALDSQLGCIGIEVKIKSSLTEVSMQVFRYMQSPKIDALLLVSTKSAHAELPDTINDKPVKVLIIGRPF